MALVLVSRTVLSSLQLQMQTVLGSTMTLVLDRLGPQGLAASRQRRGHFGCPSFAHCHPWATCESTMALVLDFQTALSSLQL